MERVISLLVGYGIGCIQTAFLVGKGFKKIDIRQHGSGNAGTTNALRVLGFRAGLITFLGDWFKAILAVLVVGYLTKEPLMAMYAGLGTVLGHNFPFYLQFKGGKGIACTAGVLLAFDYRIGLLAMLIMSIVVFITRLVSLGSLVMALWIPIALFIFYPSQWELFAVGSILTVLAFIRHKSNIVRLVNGTESKLGKKKDK